MSLIPTSGKVEFHITYRCQLDCDGCNRASFLREPVVEDMTLDDAVAFYAQADALKWKPRVVIIGGEPTLHPDFYAFIEAARFWSGTYVQVFSNAYGYGTRAKLDVARKFQNASICGETHKPGGSVRLGDRPYSEWQDDMFVSPADFGHPLRPPCWQHSSQICGVSVDHEGYSPCAPGGALGALLGVGKTKVLADLFDEEKVGKLTADLCNHCGVGIMPREEVGSCPPRFRVPMSPTWVKAFEGRR